MSEYGVLWTDAARRDLHSIVDYIAEDSVENALSVLDGDLEKSHPWDFSRREAKSAISASLHFQVFGHLKMAARPCAARAP